MAPPDPPASRARARTTSSEDHVLALLPEPHDQHEEDLEYFEPIAEQTTNKRRFCSLEKHLGTLRKQSRVQHESVMKLEVDMKSKLALEDFQRALGLAFGEIDDRMEALFRDSNHRMMTMFAPRDDLRDVQNLLGKKVSWSDHNAMLKKIADLRTYVDTVGDTFKAHIDTINVQFSRKADSATVDAALEQKTDVKEMDLISARVERLEELCECTRQEQASSLQALAKKAAAELGKAYKEHQVLVSRLAEQLSEIREDLDGTQGFGCRLKQAEQRIIHIGNETRENREVNHRLQKEHKEFLMGGLKSLRDQFCELDGCAKKAVADLDSLTVYTKDFHTSSESTFSKLRAEADASKEKQEFLLNATEMLKRRAKEMSKSNDTRFTELSDDQANLLQHLAAVERSQKTLEREVAKIELPNGQQSTISRSTRAATPESSRPLDGGGSRQSLLDQLQRIADTPLQHEQALAIADPQRPPLPWFDSDGRPCTQGLDAPATLPRFSYPAAGIPRPASVAAAHSRLSSTTPRSKSARGMRK